jgi:hypothetical protein
VHALASEKGKKARLADDANKSKMGITLFNFSLPDFGIAICNRISGAIANGSD